MRKIKHIPSKTEAEFDLCEKCQIELTPDIRKQLNAAQLRAAGKNRGIIAYMLTNHGRRGKFSL